MFTHKADDVSDVTDDHRSRLQNTIEQYLTQWYWFLPRDAAMLHGLGSRNSVCPSVCPCVTHVLCD